MKEKIEELIKQCHDIINDSDNAIRAEREKLYSCANDGWYGDMPSCATECAILAQRSTDYNHFAIMLQGLYDIALENENYKEPILDDTEREYLSTVIKPFRKKVEYIVKNDNCAQELEWVVISANWGVSLPPFDKGTMYKGMKVGKEYSIEELGL